jgi:hypothetical protein
MRALTRVDRHQLGRTRARREGNTAIHGVRAADDSVFTGCHLDAGDDRQYNNHRLLALSHDHALPPFVAARR